MSIWKIYFFGETHNTILEKDVEGGKLLDFTEEEIDFINKYAKKYAISPWNGLVENQIKTLFNIEKLR